MFLSLGPLNPVSPAVPCDRRQAVSQVAPIWGRLRPPANGGSVPAAGAAHHGGICVCVVRDSARPGSDASRFTSEGDCEIPGKALSQANNGKSRSSPKLGNQPVGEMNRDWQDAPSGWRGGRVSVTCWVSWGFPTRRRSENACRSRQGLWGAEAGLEVIKNTQAYLLLSSCLHTSTKTHLEICLFC